MNELLRLDATGQLALLGRREVSCLELLDAHLARIDELNPRLNALSAVFHEEARALARAADTASERGALHGLPFSVKADLDCMGSSTSRGVPAMRNAMPYSDAPAVARLKAEGAIPIGRGNLSEMGLRLCTDNPLHGRTLSPYEPRLTVGGSSGGDACAVATGMTPLGLGGDLGGSLRVPAACCGCVALKPTTGRVARGSSLPPRDYGPATQLMFALGPLVRSVADLRQVLPVLAGRDARDPMSVDVPLSGPAPTELSAAVVTSLPGATLPTPAVDAVRRAANALRAAGYAVEEVAPPELSRVVEVFSALLASDLEVIARQVEPFVSDTLSQHLSRVIEHGKRQRFTAFNLLSERSRLIREWSRFFEAYPVVLGPTLGGEIWPIDADLNPRDGVQRISDATRFTAPGNALGLPSLALPMGVVDGLPTSVLLYADLWREDLCMDAASVIEAASPRV
jgi:amidase